MRKSCVLLALLPLLMSVGACVGTSKSASPLSPAIAGPIEGVGITAPTVVEPAIDALVNTTTQPITLKVSNAATTGVRPLSYMFEIATDPNFTNRVFAQGAVPQGEGITSFTLPAALTAERKYYWHARAEDGANTGPFGATSAFNIFTPVVFGSPVLVSPVNDTNTGSQPRFVIANASHSGPVGPIFYLLELSRSSSFDSIPLAWQFPETPGQTELTAPVSLIAGQYFWRARAFDGGHSGPYSETQSFRSSGGSSGGGGGNPGTPCGPPYPTSPLGILECRRSQYPDAWSHDDRLAFLIGSAKDMNAAGIAGGPFGILKKEGGNNCGGYSCDILCTGQGTAQLQYDVLHNEQNPTWGAPITYPNIRIDVCEVQ
jgi:hypothetical protein